MFGGSIAREEGNPMVGDIVDVVDASGKFIAWGERRRESTYIVVLVWRSFCPCKTVDVLKKFKTTS